MDLNLSQAEKAMLAFCGVFVFIFSMVMYYSMIIVPNQASFQEAAHEAEPRPGTGEPLAREVPAPAPRQSTSAGVPGIQ